MSEKTILKKVGDIAGASFGAYHGAAAGATAFTTVSATLGTGAAIGVAAAPVLLGAAGAYAGYKGASVAVKLARDWLF